MAGKPTYLKINNVFLQDEILALKELVSNPHQTKVESLYGRLQHFGPFSPDNLREDFENKLLTKVNSLLNEKFYSCQTTLCVTYSHKYGEPSLPPHFDGDTTDLIFNYQLDSNTSWPVGVNTELVEMENNSAIMFNPNTNVHWRPHKSFNRSEYVTMVFFRFQRENPTDYSHLALSQTDPAFEEARNYRDSLM